MSPLTVGHHAGYMHSTEGSMLDISKSRASKRDLQSFFIKNEAFIALCMRIESVRDEI
jgi:hypothetical protein